MTWIKICGTTNRDDARTAVDAGADALGFVFYEKSPRNVDPETARSIVRDLPATIEKVGVFVNQFEEPICELADQVGLTAVQLHGDREDPHVADLIVKRRPELKVLVGISMHHPNPEGWAMMWRPEAVHAFLVDAGDKSKFGGTGKVFDWQADRPRVEVIARLGRVVVAGGLNPGNVGEAISILKPWGVDVASGVEASPGKKDPEKIRAFIAAIRRTDKGK
jgi:phosphoribosylanthranilate isomerase